MAGLPRLPARSVWTIDLSTYNTWSFDNAADTVVDVMLLDSEVDKRNLSGHSSTWSVLVVTGQFSECSLAGEGM